MRQVTYEEQQHVVGEADRLVEAAGGDLEQARKAAVLARTKYPIKSMGRAAKQSWLVLDLIIQRQNKAATEAANIQHARWEEREKRLAQILSWLGEMTLTRGEITKLLGTVRAYLECPSDLAELAGEMQDWMLVLANENGDAAFASSPGRAYSWYAAHTGRQWLEDN
jgi:hypothetical protein